MARLKFVPVVERVIEGMRRDVKIATHHVQLGPSRVSVMVRMPEIIRRIEADPAVKSQLLHFMDVARYARKCAGALGITSHPLFVALVRQKDFKTASWLQAVVTVVHRCELDDQFAGHALQRQQHDRQTHRNTQRAIAMHSANAREVPRTFEAIMRRCVVDHFRAQMRGWSSLCPLRTRTLCSRLLATHVAGSQKMLRSQPSWRAGLMMQSCSSEFCVRIPIG